MGYYRGLKVKLKKIQAEFLNIKHLSSTLKKNDDKC